MKKFRMNFIDQEGEESYIFGDLDIIPRVGDKVSVYGGKNDLYGLVTDVKISYFATRTGEANFAYADVHYQNMLKSNEEEG